MLLPSRGGGYSCFLNYAEFALVCKLSKKRALICKTERVEWFGMEVGKLAAVTQARTGCALSVTGRGLTDPAPHRGSLPG